jgi:hypothetical protein
MRRKYIVIATVSAFTCGAGAASWRAANHITSRIKSATHLAANAQLAAEEKAKSAEAALGMSEAAERIAWDELALERKRRQAAEQALDKAVNRTAQAVRLLAEQGNKTKSFQGKSGDAEITKEELVLTLAAQGTTKKAMEAKMEDLDIILLSLDKMIAKQVSTRKEQTELDNAVQLPQQSATTKARKTRIASKHGGEAEAYDANRLQFEGTLASRRVRTLSRGTIAGGRPRTFCVFTLSSTRRNRYRRHCWRYLGSARSR